MVDTTISVDASGKYVTMGGVGGMSSNMGAYLVGARGATGFGSSSTSTEVVAKWDGKGKTIIITGAAGGLGYEAAKALASRGAEVIMTARSMARATDGVERLKKLQADAKVVPMELDLASFESVRSFAKAFLATGKPLHVLMNNAGIMACPFSLTVDGHESQLAVNHFAHFLLTNLLLDHMIATAKADGCDGRIINTSSSMHWLPYKEGIRFDSYNDKAKYDAWGAYGQSKLANIMFTRALATRLAQAGAPVITLCLHPGAIPTELQRSMDSCSRNVFGVLARPLLKSIPQGAATQLVAATYPDLPSGEFMADCVVHPSSALSHSQQLAESLWELSVKVTGVGAHIVKGASAVAGEVPQVAEAKQTICEEHKWL